jgi:hypothetical protein
VFILLPVFVLLSVGAGGGGGTGIGGIDAGKYMILCLHLSGSEEENSSIHLNS